MYMKEHKTQWTDKQLETIALRQKNILVSAAAGSGKTAVLVERIKQLILVDHVAVDRLLVVTFTKAAASEMKEKLVNSLHRAVCDNPNQTTFIRLQLDRISRANISTFHAFALDVIRRYFHLINLDPGFKVCDEAEAKIMKSDGMEQVFETFFESQDPTFLEYIRCYGSPKNENELKKSLIALYEKIRSIPDSFQWLKEAVERLNQPEDEFLRSELMLFINQHILAKLEEARVSMIRAFDLLDHYGIQGTATLCRADIKAIEEMLASAQHGDFEKTRQLIIHFKPNTMTAPKAQKEDYALIKDYVKGFRERAKDIIRKEIQPKYFGASLTESMSDIHQTYEMGQVLFKLLEEFHQEYSEMKRQKSLLDFSDIEHFAIEILRNPMAVQEYREKFQYIFIDEYQDSNLLQETIIESIQQHDNVFMVGDIKQSIYKFRLAEPEIFQKKYALYKDPNVINSTKIDLNKNFRSKESILRAVNGIFSNLMDYNQDAALYRGIPLLDFPDKPVELFIVNGTSSATESLEFTDDTIEELKTTELEALAAAEIIKNALGTTIYDVKAGVERPLRKRDIVILMHGVKRKADIFYQALMDVEIDAYVDDHAGYFDTLEIISFSDLLKVIDNQKRDLPLLGVLRTPIFGFSIDDFIEIRSQSRESTFHGALIRYEQQGRKPELKHRIQLVLSKMNQWKKESRYIPIDEFSWKLMCETGYYTYVGALPGGALRQANLRIFVERAKAFRANGDGSIYGLLRYMDSLAAKEVETGQASIVGENDDTVRIMTIHKSKGLEFPFVLVASLGKRFVNDKMDKTGVIHKDLGIGLTLFNSAEKWYRNTLAQNAIVSKKRKEEMDESVRVLYVAFTRAMDKLVLLGSTSNWEKEELKYESGTKAETNYLGMIFPYLELAGINFNIIDRDNLQQKLKKQRHTDFSMDHLITAAMADPINLKQQDLIQWVDQRLSYRYANEADKNKKSKYSVSEMNASHYVDSTVSMPRFLNAKQGYTPAEKGSVMHIVMEHIDPKRYHQFEYLETYLHQLVSSELLLPNEAETVELSNILTLAEGQLGKRMAAATVLHREQAFNLLYPHEGTEVMVQGVIDCWFEEEGNVVLVDYKTGKDGWRMDDRYRAQLRLYKNALETILEKNVSETYLYLFAEGRVLQVNTDE
jgi:ATP-dependent helicase/nuclease subunit A